MNKLVAAIFLLFALVQYNDPDFYIWVPAYLLVSILIILYDRGKPINRAFLIAAVGYAVWMFTYIPNLIHWIQEGLPSITGTMKAESPFIEFVREFFGLAICLLATVIYWKKSRR